MNLEIVGSPDTASKVCIICDDCVECLFENWQRFIDNFQCTDDVCDMDTGDVLLDKKHHQALYTILNTWVHPTNKNIIKVQFISPDKVLKWNTRPVAPKRLLLEDESQYRECPKCKEKKLNADDISPNVWTCKHCNYSFWQAHIGP